MARTKYLGNIKHFLFFSIIIFFIFIPHFYNQRLEKNIFKIDFYLIWIAGCFCWIYNLIYSPFSFNRLNIIFLIGCTYVLVSWLFNTFLDENSKHVLISVICFIGITHFLQINYDSKFYLGTVAAILFVYLVQVYIGLFQAVENNWESLTIKGSLYNSGFFGNYLASMIPLLFSSFFSKTSFKLYIRLTFFIIFFIVIALLCLTIARSAIIGTIIGCLAILLYHKKDIKLKKYLTISIISFLVIPLLVIAMYKLKRDSASGRLTIYKVSLNIIKDHTLTGVGPNRFSAVYNNYQSEYFKKLQTPYQTQLLADNTFEAFNSVIQMLVEYGFVGFFIIIGFIYQLVKEQKNTDEIPNKMWLRIGSIGCLFSIIVSSLFSNPLHVTPILLIFAYHLSVVLPKQKNNILLLNRQTLFPLFIFITFASFVFYYAIIHYKGEIVWQEASESAKYSTFSNAKNQYEKAYPILKYNGDFLFNYGAEASLANDYNLAITLLEDAKKYNSFSNLFLFLGNAYLGVKQFGLAEKNYLQAIYIAPSHIYPKFQLIQLYKKWNKPELANMWTIKTLQYPIKIKSTLANDLLNELKEDIRK